MFYSKSKYFVLFALLFLASFFVFNPLVATANVGDTSMIEVSGSLSQDLGAPAGSLDKTQPAQVTLVLTPRNQAQLETLSLSIQDPTSANYRKTLTDSAFSKTFAPDPQTVSAVVTYYKSLGLSLTYQSNTGLVLGFSGTVGQLDTAFATTSQLRSNASGLTGRINVAPYKIPVTFSGLIQGVIGFDQLHRVQNNAARTTATSSTGTVSYSTPASLRTSYKFPANLTGNGTKVGVVLWAAPNTNDVTRWKTANGIKGKLDVLPAGTAASTDDSLRFEANMDVQMVLSAAPDANVRFFVASSNSYDSLATAIQQAIDDNVSVITNSWGGCERSMSTATINSYHTIFQNAATKGIPVLFSSGDNGSFDCNSGGATSVAGYGQFPASDPLVTSVGGTTLQRDSSTNAWMGETAWSCTTTDGSSDKTCLQGTGGASSGGMAVNIARPGFQSALAPAKEAKFTNTATNTRLQPDISLNADPRSGEKIYYTSSYCNDNCLSGGTSAAAPFLAGIVALAAQQNGSQTAGLNTFLYTKFSTAWGYDVVSGYTGVSAKTGWDYTTGLGSINNVSQFLNSYVGVANYAVNAYTITDLFPAVVPVKSQGGVSFTLSVNGSNFTANTKIFWNGTARATTLVNDHQVTATIPDSELASSGTASVYVGNAAGDGTQSNSLSVTIAANCVNSVVTRLDDANTCGSLRYALRTASSGTTINIALVSGQKIVLGSGALSVPAGVSVNGFCSAGGPGITVSGGATGDSLYLGGNNTLYGLALVGFGGGQSKARVVTPAGSKVSLRCVQVRGS